MCVHVCVCVCVCVRERERERETERSVFAYIGKNSTYIFLLEQNQPNQEMYRGFVCNHTRAKTQTHSFLLSQCSLFLAYLCCPEERGVILA